VENQPVIPVGNNLKPVSPLAEPKRLELLRAVGILDTAREQQFDDIALLASTICETPFALITFVDRDRVWFKSKIGLTVSEVSRGSWFCEEAILQQEVFVVSDALKDERFQGNPLVVSGPKIRFYAGVPLSMEKGATIGTLCVLDVKPRGLNSREEEVLKALGRLVVMLLASQRNLSDVIEELKINKELAGSATRVKSSFLANMSHEIRTPMTAILGMTDLLLSGDLKEDQREYIDTIRSSGESLLNTINDILDYSKIESGRMELDRQPFDLRACIEDTLDTFSQKAHGQGNELVYVIDSGVSQRIVGDVARIRQILANLIDNAIKFTRNGEIFLSVLSKKHPDRDLELIFSVKDTGIGIPRDKLESIFEAFTQVDSSVTRKYGGTGLGLVICSRLVSLMGGRIEVDSVEGQGSKFSFSIRTTALADQESSRAQEKSAELEGRRIVIVDDSMTNLQILSEECKQWGMIPFPVSSPMEALRLLRQGDSFDLAIYDMQMPEKDGVQLALETRKLPKLPQFPIILLSSWDLSDPRIKLHHELFAATVMKPLKMSQFQSLLKGVIGKQASEKAISNRALSTTQDLATELPASIIVAEDNLINQKLIQRMLRSMGYEPTIVGTGLEVLSTLDQALVDLVFMDVQMPEMDGLEATQKIRQRYGAGAGPRIVAMTAFALAGDKEKCLKAGMDDYLSKPFVSDQVASMIRKWVGDKNNPMNGTESPEGRETPSIDGGILVRLNELEQETERSFVKDLIKIFLEEAPESFQRMKDAISTSDAKAIEQFAHKLKGGSINLGAKRLSGLFENVEQLARKNEAERVGSFIAEIKEEFGRTVNFLRDYSAAP
jgi:signal transduction histidine kinase/CheY-like chemotaxis protein/HPt (histidine-containing phosphotransfer) domain-containing protein